MRRARGTFFTVAVPGVVLACACGLASACGGRTAGGSDAAPATDASAAGSDAVPPGEPIGPVPGDNLPGGGPYPIVLCHGMGGWDAVGGFEYFYGVEASLTSLGHVVFTTEVPQFDSVANRAAVLAPQIDAVLAATGASKVNLIGHSQGGLDVRYLVSSLGYAPLVASITTIGTPHFGTPVADLVAGVIPGPATGAVDELIALFGPLLGQSPESDLMAGLADLTTANMTGVFNPANPDVPGVWYFSLGGVCHFPPYAIGEEDLCDLEIQPTAAWLYEVAGPNDGLLPETSAHWGTYLGVLPADHLDQVGQIGGITSLAFDHLAFYAALADFLVAQGL